PDNEPLRGIGVGAFPLDATLPGGEYVLTVRELRGRIPETRTRFLVQKAGAVRLESAWPWHRPEYQPGEPVVASATLVRGSGEPLRNQRVVATLVGDGKPLVEPQMLTTDAQGRLQFQSRLPAAPGPATLV